MAIPKPLENFWKKIQSHVYYDAVKWIVIAVVSFMTPFVFQWVESIRHTPQLGLVNAAILALLVFCALLQTIIFFRGSGTTGTPHLVLSLGDLVWTYRTEDNSTAVFILASLINKGDPSVAMNWKVTYRVGTSIELCAMYNIIGSYTLNVDKTTRITFTNDNLLNLKTQETPIQRGQWIGGRILFAIPGDRTAQIASVQHTIEIECRDYLGKITSAMYVPSATPPKSLLSHPKEKMESIKQEERNALKQPASVSYNQDPPSLGDGTKLP